MTEPTLLLADEPTGNLDSHMTVEIMSLFQELNDQGITIVLVTHEPDVAQYRSASSRCVTDASSATIRWRTGTMPRTTAGALATEPEEDDDGARQEAA